MITEGQPSWMKWDGLLLCESLFCGAVESITSITSYRLRIQFISRIFRSSRQKSCPVILYFYNVVYIHIPVY